MCRGITRLGKKGNSSGWSSLSLAKNSSYSLGVRVIPYEEADGPEMELDECLYKGVSNGLSHMSNGMEDDHATDYLMCIEDGYLYHDQWKSGED